MKQGKGQWLRKDLRIKTLGVLSVVQIIVILFLVGKVTDIDNRIRSIVPADQNNSVSEMAEKSAFPTYSDEANHYLTAEQLRHILGEELQVYFDTRTPVDKEGYLKDAPDSIDNVENQYQLELVAQKIEYYSSVGTISDPEMRELQKEIAKLNREGQQKMLIQLIKTMNAGQIEGRL